MGVSPQEMNRHSKSAAQANGWQMSRAPMVSDPSSPVTRRCHIIDNRHSMQVSKNTVSKNTAADFHRRRLLMSLVSCAAIPALSRDWRSQMEHHREARETEPRAWAIG